MAKLFDIERNRVVVNPDVLAIPAMKLLWDRDKTKEKEKALKEISYVVFLCDFHSPYKDLRTDDKEVEIKKDLFNDVKWKPDAAILKAVELYYKLQTTPSIRMLKAAQKAVEKMADWFERVDLDEEDLTGKFKYSANDVSRNLKEIGNIVKSLSNLEKQVRIELDDTSVRGRSEIGIFEDPDESDEIDDTFETD